MLQRTPKRWRSAPIGASAMRKTAVFVVLFHTLLISDLSAKERFQSVQVADPYTELRTGPGRGYPIFHVVERGERVEILKRRTDWFKVRTQDDVEGWAEHDQMERTLTEVGSKKTFRDVLLKDYLSRRLEFGFAGGQFSGDAVMSMRAGWRMTDNFLAELSLSQVSGTFSGSRLYNANLLVQPFPRWRISPYFTLGVGRFENVPRSTLVDAKTVTSVAPNAGGGIRMYLTRRFVLRVDYKHFVSLTDDNKNNTFNEVVAGLSFFF